MFAELILLRRNLSKAKRNKDRNVRAIQVNRVSLERWKKGANRRIIPAVIATCRHARFHAACKLIHRGNLSREPSKRRLSYCCRQIAFPVSRYWCFYYNVSTAFLTKLPGGVAIFLRNKLAAVSSRQRRLPIRARHAIRFPLVLSNNHPSSKTLSRQNLFSVRQ